MRADGRGKMAAGGKAENADALGINAPLPGMLAYQAHGALRVLEGLDGFRIGAAPGHPILEQHASNAFGREPVATFRAFEINGENTVTAAGKNNHRRDGPRARVLGLIER